MLNPGSGATTAARTLRRDTASSGRAAARRAARQSKSVRFTALLHHITVDFLMRSYLALERDSPLGIDGETWQASGGNLEEKTDEAYVAVGARVLLSANPVSRNFQFTTYSPATMYELDSAPELMGY